MGNAIKFTETGEVIVEVDRQSQHNNEVTLHFAVSDTGIGIPVEKQQTIFRAFEQAVLQDMFDRVSASRVKSARSRSVEGR